MFKELASLLRKGDTVLATIALIENADPAHPRFRLTVHPKLADIGETAAKVLNKPFAIEGTADELDVELPLNLQGFATSTGTQRDVFAQLETERKAAEAEAKKDTEAARKAADEAKKKRPTPTVPPKAAPAPAKAPIKAAVTPTKPTPAVKPTVAAPAPAPTSAAPPAPAVTTAVTSTPSMPTSKPVEIDIF